MSGAWILASLSRLKLSDLLQLRDECEAERALHIPRPSTKAQIIEALEAERRKYWNEVSRSPQEAARTNALRPVSTASRKAEPSPHTITAEECNEFLRSLPPVPLWGEATE